MVRRATYGRRRRFKRRKYAFSKRQNYAIKKIMAGEAEQKYIDTTISENPYADNGTVTLLTGVATGDSQITRDGNKIKLHSIQFRCGIQDVGATNAVGDVWCRWMIVRALDCNGALPNIFTAGADSILEGTTVTQLRNKLYMGDFRIVRDKFFVLKKADTVGHQSRRFIDKYIKFKKPINTTYDETGASIGNCERNHLFLVLMTTAANTDQPQWTGKVRVRFTDI